MKRKKLIITGASGFIGKDLLKRIDFNQYEITAISRNPDKLRALNYKHLNIVKADLNNSDELIEAFRGQDILINLAAEVRDSGKLADTNIDGTHNLVLAIKSSGISRCIHLSSVGVTGAGYQIDDRHVDEDFVCNPQNEYERTKALSEEILKKASEVENFQLQVLRPTNVFGEEHPFNALLNLIQQINNGNILPFSKHAKVNYVYVGDLNCVILHLLEQSNVNDTYNVGSSMELRRFYEMIGRNLRVKSKLIRIPTIVIRLLNLFKITKLHSISNATVYSDRKLKQVVDYSIGIEKGLQNTIDYYLNKGLVK